MAVLKNMAFRSFINISQFCTNMARVVVTGGAGFIGSHIVDALVKQGDEVIIVDNLVATNGSLRNIAHLLNSPKVKFSRTDIRDTEKMTQICDGADYVLHQAAMRSVPASWKGWREYYDGNVNGTWSVFEAARIAKVKAVVFASSSSVYGATKVFLQHENLPTQPLAPYPISKDTNEKQAFAYALQHKLPIVGLRYFNVFGERQDPTSNYAAVIPKFIDCILNDKPVPVEWDGEQSRDFTYVGNVVAANLRAAEWAAAVLCNREIPCEIFNIANGTPTSVNEIARQISKILNKSYSVQHCEKRPGDMRSTCADPSKAEREMGYRGVTSFEEGVKRATQWLVNNPDFFKS